MNLDTMNEQGVREAIIYPLLTKLGYEPGTEADILFEYPLHYDRFFLGHKSKNDPILRGRADYVCQVVRTTRWTIEAKPPSKPLTDSDVKQAFTYAAHPDVAAPLFVLTNGREFRLYETFHLEEPALACSVEDLPQRMEDIRSILSPDAIRKRYRNIRIGLEEEVGPGLGKWAKVAGGTITYREFSCPSEEAMAVLRPRMGLRSSVREGLAYFLMDGGLQAEILVAQNDAKFDALARLMGMECFSFGSGDLRLSTDQQKPSVLTGQSRGRMPAGADLSRIPGSKIQRAPIDIDFLSNIRAVGFLERDHFKGTFEYSTSFSAEPPGFSALQLAALKVAFDQVRQNAWGDFDLTLVGVGPDEVRRIHGAFAETRRQAAL
jgi:hypothetical protein